MVNSDLPEEILIDIFSRLPAKSIGKCRCLSKQWRTQLSTPQFVKTHLIRKTHHESFIFISKCLTIHSIDSIEDGVVSRKIKLPHRWMRVLGSCDGLVLLLNCTNNIFLLNPVTLQLARVPDTYKTRNYCDYGFGYDSCVDDYKIVEIRHYFPDTGHYTFVDVYYVKRGFWKRVENTLYIPNPLAVTRGAFLNGAIHWLAHKRDESGRIYSTIAAFDLAREVFDEIPLPSGFSNVGGIVLDDLVVFDGCLCMVNSKRNTETDVWIVKEYGLAESWTKYSFRGDCYWKKLKPLLYIGGREDVLVSTLETLHFYNVKVGKL